MKKGMQHMPLLKYFQLLTEQSRKDRVLIVECRGQDAARFQNIDHAHG